MNILLIILFIVGGIIPLLLIIALISTKEYKVTRDIVITEPAKYEEERRRDVMKLL